jgi:hypothetical protein
MKHWRWKLQQHLPIAAARQAANAEMCRGLSYEIDFTQRLSTHCICQFFLYEGATYVT